MRWRSFFLFLYIYFICFSELFSNTYTEKNEREREREREREKERESAQSNKFDQVLDHASSKGSCLSFLGAICLLGSYKDFMEDINPL